LDDYYAFIWDPKINDFPVINDPITGERINFPCRADRLEQWLLESNDVAQMTMDNRKAGRESTLSGQGWGENKRKYYEGNWGDFIECLNNTWDPGFGGGPGYTVDDCTPLDSCNSQYCNDTYWIDYYYNVWAKCGTYESGAIQKTNSLTGQTDTKSLTVIRSCYEDGGKGHDDRYALGISDIKGVLIPSTGSNHDAYSSYIHSMDGFEENTETRELVNHYNKEDWIEPTWSYDIRSDIWYTTDTFLGNMYNDWEIREYEKIGGVSASYHARALLAQGFGVGARCAQGTFIWLGLQGKVLKISNWSSPIDKPWIIEPGDHNYVLAYCDSNGYGTDPFTNKLDNSAISDTIKEMIDRFYEEDPGGAVLEFDADVRWVSGPAGSYSSLSSLSISSSSLSSSSISISKESSSSESISSTSSSSESSA